MKKQTAVNWLESKFIELESTIGVHGKIYELIEKAKEMEMEQIVNAFEDGQSELSLKDKHDYYNETYGGKK
jgi:hypothetical protein